MPPPPPRSGIPSWVIFIAVVLAVSFAAKLVLDSASRAPARAMESTVDAARSVALRAAGVIRDVFQVEPQIQIQSEVIQLQSSPILELALMERDFHLSNTWKGRWLHSEKELTVSGSYTAKAGFDLEKKFEVKVYETEQQVYLYLPAPEVLSLDLSDDLKLAGKSGLWNRITDEDRTLVMNDFRRDAEAHVVASDLLSETQRQVEKRIREALPSEEWELLILFQSVESGSE